MYPDLNRNEMPLSLSYLMEPEVLANPYPLYHKLRSTDPVYWDPFLHAWLVTRYEDVVTVLTRFSSDRTPTPDYLTALGLEELTPLARLMVKQVIFLDPPDHRRIRGLLSVAFTPRRIEKLRGHIQKVADDLLDRVQGQEQMDIVTDLAYPLPAIVIAEILGVPASDWQTLTRWSLDFGQILGNFQHNPDRIEQMVRSTEEMCEYLLAILKERRRVPREDLISWLIAAEVSGDRLTEKEILANVVLTLVAGLETTINLIGNGIYVLLRHPEQLKKLQTEPQLIVSAVEELLRYESPSQHTARLAATDMELGGKIIRKRQAVIAMVGAANRDPERFPDPDMFDICRQNNKHIAFGWGSHFCFGAPLARLEGQIVIQTVFRRFPHLRLSDGEIAWRDNLGLRGPANLPVWL
uniref:Biotin biosynthesis cytochrome P450 n=1 Tax=Thermosporothrix sp. COM3 TaxID=2490863 RepID=A0A455SHZ4_9CHLR|nr:biotin biosynthesis cytochrome P450 [Thermosporothrix sp. COM3]